ncbi:hypothetical protein BH10PSE12_BH10PSE12_01070 [soil metagenome]
MSHPLFRPKVPPLSFERWIFGMAAASALATASLVVLVSSRSVPADSLIWVAAGIGTSYAVAMLGYAIHLRRKRRQARLALEDMRYGFNGTVTYADAASVRGRRFQSAPLGAVARISAAVGLAVLGFLFLVVEGWR